MSLPRTADVLVIGAGVIGCAAARELAGAGRSVVVVDRGAIGGEASSAAAGVLAVASGADEGAALALRRASRALVPGLAAALAEEVGVDVGFARAGVLALAFTDEEAAALAARAAARRAQGFAAETLDGPGVRACEPLASPAACAGVLFPDDAALAADRLVAALAASAGRRGATLLPGTPALAVERRGDRVTGVRVGGGTIAAGTVVLATGAWGDAGIAALAAGVGVGPVRGQMLALRPAASPGRVLTAGDAFLVPRAHGEVWVGATFEPAGFDKAVTPAGLRALAAHVERLAPALAAAPVVRTWAGLRPFRAAGGPVVGPVRGLANVVVATAHHRTGILLAAVTARAIAAYVDGGAPPVETRPFGT